MVAVAYFLIWCPNWGKGLYLTSDNIPSTHTVPSHNIAAKKYSFNKQDHKRWHLILYWQSIFSDLGERGLVVPDVILSFRETNERELRIDYEFRRPTPGLALSFENQHPSDPFSMQKALYCASSANSPRNKGICAVRGVLKAFPA